MKIHIDNNLWGWLSLIIWKNSNEAAIPGLIQPPEWDEYYLDRCRATLIDIKLAKGYLEYVVNWLPMNENILYFILK